MDSLAEHVEAAPLIEAPTSIEDLRKRPNFQAPVDPRRHRLAEVLVDYYFEREVPCGLSTCNQGHNRGLLVRTESGIETNIGHVCGKNHFGEDFDSASARFQRAKDRREALGRLRALAEQAPRVIDRVSQLINSPFGVRWVHALRDAVRTRLGSDAFAHLTFIANRGDYEVVRVEERSESEVRRLMREQGIKRDEAQYKKEPLGRLAPMDWISWNFRDELLIGVQAPFRELPAIDFSDLDTRELKYRLKPFANWEQRIAQAEARLADAQRFLAPQNLALADAALDAHFKARAATEYCRLSDWPGSAHYASLVAGEASMPPSVALGAPPKPMSKGKARKLRRHGRR